MSSAKRSLQALIATLVAVLVLTSASMASARQLATRPAPAPTSSTLVLTKNGKPVSRQNAPCFATVADCANDLHFTWRTSRSCYRGIEIPLVAVLWTVSGSPVHVSWAPCKSNDFEFAWDDVTKIVTNASWTANGQVIGHAGPPPAAGATVNDVHVYWLKKGQLSTAYWTFNGKNVGAVKVPTGINDAHWNTQAAVAPSSDSSVRRATAPPTYLRLTHNGQTIDTLKSPCGTLPSGALYCANDLHFIWKTTDACKNGYQLPPIVLIWTVNGMAVGTKSNTQYPKLNLAPCRTNDVEWRWNANGDVIVGYWTRQGKHIAKLTPPASDVNDVSVFWTKNPLTALYWTLNGRLLKPPVQVPGGTNDAHWEPAN